MKSAAKEACWRGRLRDQAGSGLSVRAFCRRDGLSEPSFYAWRRELEKRDRERTAGTDAGATRNTAGDTAGSAGLVAVDVIGVFGEAMLEIAVAGGVVIRLREEASAETLERVLSVACRQRAAAVATDNALEREVASC